MESRRPKTIVERPSLETPNAGGLEQVAWLMDRAFRIPGTPIRVGLDSIIGLIPGGGDVLMGIVQAGIVLVAMFHYRVPRAVALRMAANVLLDVGIGAIPFVGDAFDIFFKANTRNMNLLREVEQSRAQQQSYSSASSLVYLLLIAAVFLLLLVLMFIGAVAVVMWIVKH